MWYKNVEATRHLPGILNSLIFIVLPVSMLAASRAVTGSSAQGPKSTATFAGLRPEDGPLAIVELCLTWRDAADDDFVFKTTTQFLETVLHAARKKGLEHRYIFPNYAWPSEDVMQSYGEERLAALRTVAAKWDPDGFFQTRVVGGFKISK